MAIEGRLVEMLQNRMVAALERLNPPADTYALSLYIDNQDDPRRRHAELSYNTESQCARKTPGLGPGPKSRQLASSAAEARWNYACWLQDPSIRIPAIGDHELLTVQEQWARGTGWWYEDEEEENDFERVWPLMNNLDAAMWGFFARATRRLHDSGHIASRFGRPIPVILHCLEYSDESLNHTREANPPGVGEEYLKGFQ